MYQSTLVKRAWQLIDDSHLSKRLAASTSVGHQRIPIYSRLLASRCLPSSAAITPK